MKVNGQVSVHSNVMSKVTMVVKLVTAMDYIASIAFHGLDNTISTNNRLTLYKDRDGNPVILDGISTFSGRDYPVYIQ